MTLLNLTFKNKDPKERFSCHECGKAGHMKFECPIYIKKVEGEKNTSRDFKSKKAYIESTTSTSREEETAKICLMVNDHEQAPIQKLTNLVSISPTYDELYNAFVELNEELKKAVKKEINELKLENETLDLIYSNASCMCSCKIIETSVCETCHDLKVENDDLKNKMAKFTYGSQSLDILLASSKNVGNRISLGFKRKNYKRPNRKHVEHRHNVNKHKLTTCFYYGIHGHTSDSCYIKRHGVPSGKYVWVAKGSPGSVTNKKDPI
ncbi:hypothetical protein Lal_00042899 [Lupinus albus]|nr:hypothetical protein Lal_00042899 [Lupinus albus]